MGVNFEILIQSHLEIAREVRREGRPVMGTICSSFPVEILHTFGILPIRLWGGAEEICRADARVQTYVCPPVRHLMALGLGGRYHFLDGLVHGYSCDAACGLFNIWRRNLKPPFARLVSLPYQATEDAVAYAMAELRGLIGALETYTGRRFSEEALIRSIHLYEEARQLIRGLYHLKQEGAAIPYRDLHRANLAMHLLPIERLIPLLREYRSQAAAADSSVFHGGAVKSSSTGSSGEDGKHRDVAAADHKRILISGSVVSGEGYFDLIERLGGWIVADDTCLGWRLLQGSIADNGDPLWALTVYTLERPPCASRADLPSRRRYFQDTITEAGVEAVIFLHQKFCDSHLSDHPLLKKTLEEQGIPQLQCEIEGEDLTAQVRTRIESFFELLGKL